MTPLSFRRSTLLHITTIVLAGALSASTAAAAGKWITLFDGKDLKRWTTRSDIAKDIWTVKDGVIDCSPIAEPRVDKNLWSKRSFGDFTLKLEWRISDLKGMSEIPTILPDGSYQLDDKGEKVLTTMPVADSGVYVRGSSKHQINIWNWGIGSGEVYGYRNNNPDATVRASVTPSENADKPVGEWNTFEITMQGKDLTVVLNGKTVLDKARLAEAAEFAPIALQHHGGYDAKTDTWRPSSSTVQFRNIKIKEL
ncbi:DUF1080 domain-containing protein [Opitutaceae bacterium]|nr:DUF1080 domain-containing protein [Opitutaceae bacterium]